MSNTTAFDALTTAWTNEELYDINAAFYGRPPEELLSWAAECFGPKLVLTCSFGGASGMVLLDMVARLGAGTPILFLDTNLLFPETYALAELAARRYNLNIQHREPALTLAQQNYAEGPNLYARNPDRCCGMRKVAPLAKALRPYNAWISGIRRDQASTRAATDLVQWSSRHNLLKISPLAYWSEQEVWRYIHAHNVPYNRLLDQGYTSLGCAPCTHPSTSHDLRAGRWAGFAKTECGIHL